MHAVAQLLAADHRTQTKRRARVIWHNSSVPSAIWVPICPAELHGAGQSPDDPRAVSNRPCGLPGAPSHLRLAARAFISHLGHHKSCAHAGRRVTHHRLGPVCSAPPGPASAMPSRWRCAPRPLADPTRRNNPPPAVKGAATCTSLPPFGVSAERMDGELAAAPWPTLRPAEPWRPSALLTRFMLRRRACRAARAAGGPQEGTMHTRLRNRRT